MSVDKDKLRDMLDSLIDDNPEQAQVHFHSYLEDKMKDHVGTVIPNLTPSDDSDSTE